MAVARGSHTTALWPVAKGVKPALLVIDMIVDFTTGRLGSAAARGIVPTVRRTIHAARQAKIPVIYVQDAHRRADPELAVWGPHAMAGSQGAATHPALIPQRGEPVVRKRALSGFFRTPLERLLRARRVDTVVLTGIATEYCVQHMAADAHFRGFRVKVVQDATAGLTPRAKRAALAYMRKTYGAEMLSS